MFENILRIFKKMNKKSGQEENKTNKDEAKERLHLVLMQDRANVSADFLDLMRQEIIDVIKKYIDVDEKDIDVRLTNKQNSDGTTGAPALYANIPIKSIKNETKNTVKEKQKEEKKQEKEKNIEEKDVKEENAKIEKEENAKIEKEETKERQEEEKTENQEIGKEEENQEIENQNKKEEKDSVENGKNKTKEKKTIKKK